MPRDHQGRYMQQDRQERRSGAAGEHASLKGRAGQGPRAMQQAGVAGAAGAGFPHGPAHPKNSKAPRRREPTAGGAGAPGSGGPGLGNTTDPKGMQARGVKHKQEQPAEAFGAGRVASVGQNGRAIPGAYDAIGAQMNQKSGHLQSSANSELVSGQTGPPVARLGGPVPGANREDHEMDVNFGPTQAGLPEGRTVPYTAGDDEEECAHCGSRYAQHTDQEGADMSWIGCSYEECGKWYHQVCIGMPDEEYRRVTANEDQDWFCTDDCRASHLAHRGERAAVETDAK